MTKLHGTSQRVPQAGDLTQTGLVILDFDGVVANSEVISLSTLRAAMGEFGLHLEPDQVRHRYLGVAIDKIEQDLEAQGSFRTSVGFRKAWHDALFERFRNELTPVPGLAGLLDRIDDRGIPYCIASSGTLDRIGVALDSMRLGGRFKHVFSAQQVEHGKPAPDLFLHAADAFNILPGQCLVIEDSPHGIRAAKSAGMRAIGFLGGEHLTGIRDAHRKLLIEADADEVFESLDEIMIG